MQVETPDHTSVTKPLTCIKPTPTALCIIAQLKQHTSVINQFKPQHYQWNADYQDPASLSVSEEPPIMIII